MATISWKDLTYNIADATRSAYGVTDKIKLVDLSDMISALYVCNGKIHFSSTAPTADDGSDNDIWVVIE